MRFVSTMQNASTTTLLLVLLLSAFVVVQLSSLHAEAGGGACQRNLDCNWHLAQTSGFCDQSTNKCRCYAGIDGPQCQCRPVESCSGHGTCNTNGLCQCFPGWTGSDCNTCSNNKCGPQCDQTCPAPLFCTDTTVLQGQKDFFALPLDGATSPSTALINSVNPFPHNRAYDQALPLNVFFTTTFTLPAVVAGSDITAATLKIRAKPYQNSSTNDTIGLRVYNGNTLVATWGAHFGTGFGFSLDMFGTWSSFQIPANGQLFTLDLNALPTGPQSTMSLIANMNSFRNLSIVVQDDTAVDFAELKYTICSQCQTTTTLHGTKDNFASPIENTSPSAALATLIAASSAAPAKQFDAAVTDAFLGDSFLNLPSNISSAKLRFKAKPLTSIPSNDTIGFYTFDNNNNRIASGGICLGGSGCLRPNSWTPGNFPTGYDFTVDLSTIAATFPPTNNPYSTVLDFIKDTRRLDIIVQDDSVVDYFELEVTVCVPTVQQQPAVCSSISDCNGQNNSSGCVNGQCQCLPGIGGKNCQCRPVETCNGHGTCDLSTGACMCHPNSSGLYCEIF